jgi:unsaturated rhamnogalacturonyl hydrolase
MLTRRTALQLTAAALAAPRTLLAAPKPDWSAGIMATTMHRTPDAKDLGGWGYAISLYLYGQYLFFKRTGDKKYLDYIQRWVDAHVSDAGVIDRKIDALDYMLPGNLLLILHKETGAAKYKTAADSIRARFDTYPRTAGGGFWHALSRQHQLWLDGMFMSMPFLVRYGAQYNDLSYACDEAAKQLLIYASHLNDTTTGLMFHAYDESGAQPWADPTTHHSAYFWCRAIGWFGMAIIEVLELMPHTHSQRPKLLAQLRQLAAAYKKYQDPTSGLWFQIVDKGSLAANWLETSSSCMFVYTLDRAIERGYIPHSYSSVVRHGHAGVLAKLDRDPDPENDQAGFAHIHDICEGTNVSGLDYYLNRKRNTDDFHGLGAFLIMNEQLTRRHLA